jgi:thioredoxin 2
MNATNESQVDALHGVQTVCGHCFATNRVPGSRLRDDPKYGKCSQPLLDGEPVAVDERSFDQFIARSDLPVVVDFWAAWCAPCRMMAPTFESVARDLRASVRFAKVDVDAAPAVARRFGVSSIPTLVLFQQGTEVRRIAGAMSAAQLKGWIGEGS